MERVNIFFLHGFLGRPADWIPVKSHLPLEMGWRLHVPDYMKDPALTPHHDFERWGANFNRWVESQTTVDARNILVGYSLGGRLAMHALENKPSLWQHVILLSANPGFNDNHTIGDGHSEERAQRWINDSYWAEQFKNAPWETVVKNWNAQPVFSGGSEEPLRMEKDHDREHLSLSLTQWSLAQQKNMRGILRKNAAKVSLMVGELDEKFVRISLGLKNEVPGMRIEFIPEASHRLLFDQPKILADKIRSLLKH